MDDGSESPLKGEMRNLTWYYTNDKRPWTQGLARNLGASKARGEFLFLTDIDHIITREALDDVLNFTEDKMIFYRYYGILNEDGDIVSDEKSMLEFGLHPARVYTRRGYLCAGIHSNTYAIRKSVFDMIGGYDHRLCEQMFHMGGKFNSEEAKFNHKYNALNVRGLAKDTAVSTSKIYHFPVSKFRTDGDNNPFGLFHSLSLEQVPQPMMR